MICPGVPRSKDSDVVLVGDLFAMTPEMVLKFEWESVFETGPDGKGLEALCLERKATSIFENDFSRYAASGWYTWGS